MIIGPEILNRYPVYSLTCLVTFVKMWLLPYNITNNFVILNAYMNAIRIKIFMYVTAIGFEYLMT